MKTEQDLKQLAKRVVTNEVYLAVEKEAIENSFMMLIAFGAKFPEGTVALYENYSNVMPRSINGYPMFTSCRYLSSDEFKIFQKYWKEYDEFLNDETTVS